jgi:ubiquinone/menaquinone biosynthesis C-methylase UbiE
MSEQTSARAKARWDCNYETDHAEQEQVCNIYTLASVLYWQLYGNPCLSNTGSEYGWLSWLRRVYGAPRPRHVLELGSGNGDLLLDLHRVDFADRFTGIDLSSAAIQVARDKAKQAGLENITFVEGDLNDIQLESNSFDAIVAQMCLHHVENLEGLFDQVAAALVPGGVFAVNDYVGPTRWQFTRMQLLLTNALLFLLPRRLKVSHPEGTLKTRIWRPTIQNMVDMDPSEAVRSEEILPLFAQRFAVEHCTDYGGSVSSLVLNRIIGNFREDDPQSLRWFKFILAVDHWARRCGIVPVINVVLAGRVRKG